VHVLGFYGSESAFVTALREVVVPACPTVPVTTITYQIVMSKRDRFLKESGEAVFALLKLTSASADAFPPLKSAAGALYTSLRLSGMSISYATISCQCSSLYAQKFKSNKREWTDFAIYIKDTLACIIQFFPISTSPEAILCRIWRS